MARLAAFLQPSVRPIPFAVGEVRCDKCVFISAVFSGSISWRGAAVFQFPGGSDSVRPSAAPISSSPGAGRASRTSAAAGRGGTPAGDERPAIARRSPVPESDRWPDSAGHTQTAGEPGKSCARWGDRDTRHTDTQAGRRAGAERGRCGSVSRGGGWRPSPAAAAAAGRSVGPPSVADFRRARVRDFSRGRPSAALCDATTRDAGRDEMGPAAAAQVVWGLGGGLCLRRWIWGGSRWSAALARASPGKTVASLHNGRA